MTKYELSISSNYVDGWGKVEAIRELFQNALDEQVKDPDNKMFFDYDEANNVLQIGNRNSTLEIQTLLIGNTTKKDDRFIGQHGEGYKLATIVLLRDGCGVTFNNYNTREIWTTRLVKSRKYKGSLVPTFFVDKVPFWSPIPSHSLIIRIDGITPENYEEIKNSNLHLQDNIEYIETQYGRILLDKKYKGHVYVSGLYICTNDTVSYGYDLKPAYIKLDRDRRLVGDWDLHWITSRIIADTNNVELIKECMKGNDGRFLQYNVDHKYDIINNIADSFIQEHGDNAIPVSNNDEFNRYVYGGYKAVMVSESERAIIRGSSSYVEPPLQEHSLLDRIKEWYNSISQSLSDDARSKFDTILEELEDKL